MLLLGTHLNWLVKIKLRGPWASYINIIVNYCCTPVLWYSQMLKETKTEETIVFFVTFLSLVAFQLGGARAPWPPSPGYAIDSPNSFSQAENTIKQVELKTAEIRTINNTLVTNGFPRYHHKRRPVRSDSESKHSKIMTVVPYVLNLSEPIKRVLQLVGVGVPILSVFMSCLQGCQNKGGMGGYIPPIIWLYPPPIV